VKYRIIGAAGCPVAGVPLAAGVAPQSVAPQSVRISSAPSSPGDPRLIPWSQCHRGRRSIGDRFRTSEGGLGGAYDGKAARAGTE
jgi:hypothetical protein